MKKNIKLASAFGILVLIIIMTIPKATKTTAQNKEPDEIIQTWEEFLKSGVKIECDDELNL